VLQSGKGEVDSGKRIFTNLCGACHRLFDEGGTLGPDLTGYDRKNVSDLLTNIVDPGAYVREGYVTYRITTSDGRTLSGTVAERSGKSVTVNLLTGEKLTLPEDEIKDMTPQPSMMPDNLLDGLDEQQVRDLFAYLTTMSAR
jgi:putative heme-binding domain-containing protein